jgi:ABC-type glycerol-3-phosphate transport system permease component
MGSRKSFTYVAGSIALHAVLIVGFIAAVMPYYWMITASLKTESEIFRIPPIWIVTQPKFKNYWDVFTKTIFFQGLFNSIFICATTVLLTLFFCSMAGFAFAKYSFPGRDKLFLLMLATMMIPGVVTWIPVYMVLAKIGWVNTYHGIIIPGAASAFGIFMLRQYALSLPDEILDAGRIDGCNEFMIFLRIVAPLMAPAMTTLSIFTFVWNWNSLFWPMLMLRDKAKYTVALVLNMYKPRGVDFTRIDRGGIMALCVLSTIPTVLVFFLLQRYIVGYRLAGALKGV